jgi:hypothetical protein
VAFWWKVTAARVRDSRATPYVAEYMSAYDRTERLGFKVPPRILVRKDCVDKEATTAVLLDFFSCHEPEQLVGQTAGINLALVPLLYAKTGVPYNLTIGWIIRKGKTIFKHDETLIQRFIEGKTAVWLDAGCPFHLWLTSPACEVVDVTFAMNLGWAETREECARLIIYRSRHALDEEQIYHPTLVGPDFFHSTGGML